MYMHSCGPFEHSICHFFFNATATTEIYTLSLHDALPIWPAARAARSARPPARRRPHGRSSSSPDGRYSPRAGRSEEHTSELQSRLHLVCRLLLEKKKKLNSSAACESPSDSPTPGPAHSLT